MNPSRSSPEIQYRRSPGWAAFWSVLAPGAGQIHCRQDNKGVLLLGIFLFGHWATGGISSLLLCPAMGLDAFLVAKKLNRGLAIRRWEFFPGIKGLNSIPPRIILLAVAALVAALAVIRIVRFASDYHPND